MRRGFALSRPAMATDETEQSAAGDDSERDDEAESPADRQRRERRAKERRPAPEEEPIPVFGGRLLIAAGMLAAMVVIPMSSAGNLLEPKPEIAPTSKWTVGQT